MSLVDVARALMTTLRRGELIPFILVCRATPCNWTIFCEMGKVRLAGLLAIMSRMEN